MKALAPRFYQVWIVHYEGPLPAKWHSRPPVSRRVELADAGLFSRRQANEFLKGFNMHMRQNPGRCWAVAVPIG